MFKKNPKTPGKWDGWMEPQNNPEDETGKSFEPSKPP